MTSEFKPDQFLTARTSEGMLIIHGSPVTLSWVPRDVVNGAYNVGGIVVVGTFETIEAAKAVAREQHSASSEDWRISDTLPFDAVTEVHTPEIEGHRIVRHDIHWK
jgi:hypothetical protein